MKNKIIALSIFLLLMVIGSCISWWFSWESDCECYQPPCPTYCGMEFVDGSFIVGLAITLLFSALISTLVYWFLERPRSKDLQ